MMKTELVLAIALSLPCFAVTPAKTPAAALAVRAREVQNSAIVVDTHADTPMRFVDENYDIAGPRGRGYLDLPSIKAGNLGAEFFSIWVDPSYRNGYAHRALEEIDSVYRQAQKHPADMVMAFSAADIRNARSGGHKRLAALIGVEGGHAIENNLALLRDYYRLGVRYMTLTWSNTNEWADSSGDINNEAIHHHNGLTEFGRQVVAEMNRLGMMVDISHVSDKTFWDVIATTRAPVIASHSSARALTNHARNMTDDMLKAVAKNGGVVQVNFASMFVDENVRRAFAELAQQRQKELAELDERLKNADEHTRMHEHQKLSEEWGARMPRPPLRSLIDHLDHIAKVAGVDHVGLGSDFDGIPSAPQGIDSAADLPKITEALLARGYSAEDCRKMLGGNLLRVFEQVERISHDIQAKSR